MNDPKKLADEKIKYLGGWLSNAKGITEAVPKVQRELELASWEARALSDAPGEVLNPLSDDLCISFLQDLEILEHAMPRLPEINLKLFDVGSGSTAATASGIYTITNQARYSKVAPIREWGNRISEDYLLLQGHIKREEEAKNLLIKLKPNLGTEFENASGEVLKCLAGTGDLVSAGIAMRNLLEHYKGELFNLARKHMSEQKLKWPEISERLVSPGILRDRFNKQEERWNQLQQRLSKLAKGHITIDKANLKSIFAELIDHLYITLSLAQLP